VFVDTGTATSNYVGRFDGTTANTTASWFAGGLSGTAPAFTRAVGDTYPSSIENTSAVDTFGAANPAAPSSVADWMSF
jgi:TRAP-type C4-dicarboxylate transport system permease large subunit